MLVEVLIKRAGSLARLGHLLDVQYMNDLLKSFKEFLLIDLRRSEKTVYEKLWYISKFLKTLHKPLRYVTRDDIRSYLKQFVKSNATYKNVLSSLKTFFRDFLERPEVVRSFKFPREPFKPRIILTREELQIFYEAIDSLKEKALFLMYATSGLRRNEILTLTLNNVDFQKRMIIPEIHKGDSKKSLVSFYNEECEEVLRQYLEMRKSNSERIFPFARNRERKLWKEARDKRGLDITPQRLREFFCMEMANLGVQDRFIDAFTGRTPRTILARHYTDYNPIKLKKIYDKANIRILS